MSLLLTHIKSLYQVRNAVPHLLRGAAMNEVPVLHDAYVYIEDGKIKQHGLMCDMPALAAENIQDCSDYIITPGYIDSHTHLIHAATREGEFVDRINGLSYEAIAARGGGILNSVSKLRKLSEEELFERSLIRLLRVLKMGTTTVEVKSGYGLDTENEIKMLRVARRLEQQMKEEGIPIILKTTFLGAHALPFEYKQNPDRYIDKVIHEMLPAIAEEQLADFIDIFCESDYFNVKHLEQIIQAGSDVGLPAKVHVNQFNSLGGIAVAVDNVALSVDHLEVMNAIDIEKLSGATTIATALPGCSFFLGLDYAPVKELLENEVAISLASDYNPGSSPSANLNLVQSLACLKMGLTPQQAFNAVTINAAHSLHLQDEVGSIGPGMKADLLFFEDIDRLEGIAYHFGENMIDRVMIAGNWLD